MGANRFSALFGGGGQIALSCYITVLIIRFNRWPEFVCLMFWGDFFSGLDFENSVMVVNAKSVKKARFYQHYFFSLGHNWTRTVSKPSSRCWRSQVFWDRTVSKKRAVTPADQGFLAGDALLTRSSLKMLEQISSVNLKSKYSKTSI